MLIKAIVVVVVAAAVVPIFRTFWQMDWNLHSFKHHPGKCRKVRTYGTGSEDFQILSSGLTFITSGLTTNTQSPQYKNYVTKRGKGAIQVLDLSKPELESRVLPIKHGKDFNPDSFGPHGLSVLEDKAKGEHLVYVVNHVENQPDRIEKFRYSPKTRELIHLRSFLGDAVRVVNDMTVVEEDKFYISNCLYFNNALHKLELLYQLRLGDLVFYNGTGFTSVSGRMFNINGVMMSEDRRFLYVAQSHKETVEVYRRESDYDLRLIQEVNVHTFPDNFHLSENGDSLYLGCHPIMYKVISHLMDPENETPSQVLRLPLRDGLIVEEEITEEFYDQGDFISGSSVAGVFNNKMLIGSVIESLVMCELPPKSH